MIFCQECQKRTGKGLFADQPEHDRHAGSPWNKHTVEVLDLRKARWMLHCPQCLDQAAEGTPETGMKDRHVSLGFAPNGDEVVECANCHARYLFNDRWTFGTQQTPPKQLSLVRSKAYVVIPHEDVDLNEMEFYGSQRSAEDRIVEMENEALREAGYEETLGVDRWVSPTGEKMDRGDALYDAEQETYDFPPRPELEEVEILD